VVWCAVISGTVAWCGRAALLVTPLHRSCPAPLPPLLSRSVVPNKIKVIPTLGPRPPLTSTLQVLLTAGLSLLPGKCYSRLAWGPEGLIAGACGTTLHFIDSRSGEVVDRVEEAHDAAVRGAWRGDGAGVGVGVLVLVFL
jgi:hypothetical protein